MAVVDASVAVKWLVAELDSNHAERLLREWNRNGVPIEAPIMIFTEVSNVLFKKAQRGEIAAGDVQQLLENLTNMDIRLFDNLAMHVRAIELAFTLGEQDAYDCHYLALAEHLDCEFWTADRAFYDAAQRSFPSVRYIRPIPNS